MTQPATEHKIYITAKTRMCAESKIRRRAFVIHILFGWYSFCLIVLSLGQFSNTYNIPHGGILSLILSIALFALSFFIYGERYNERADKFRLCYLKLQELFNSGAGQESKMASYSRILEQFDNHSAADYDDMLFDSWIRNQVIEGPKGPYKITIKSGLLVIIRRLVFYVIFFGLFTAPVFVGLEFGGPAAPETTAERPVVNGR
jgi:hypothetical protein